MPGCGFGIADDESGDGMDRFLTCYAFKLVFIIFMVFWAR